MVYMPDGKYVPTLSEFKNRFRRPNYLYDTRVDEDTRQAQSREWYKNIEDQYYELYGQEKIE